MLYHGSASRMGRCQAMSTTVLVNVQNRGTEYSPYRDATLEPQRIEPHYPHLSLCGPRAGHLGSSQCILAVELGACSASKAQRTRLRVVYH